VSNQKDLGTPWNPVTIWRNGQVWNEASLLDPLRWRKPRRVLVNSMSDLFHEALPDEAIDRVFAVMAMAPEHTFQVLTKRAERMATWFGRPYLLGRILEACERIDRWPNGSEPPLRLPLPNVWLGVSVEDQATADDRIPLLLQTPAAVRFVSADPLLDRITFRWAPWDDGGPHPRRKTQLPDVRRGKRVLAGNADDLDGLRMLDWVIVAGKSGPRARPMHPDWVRSIRDECVEARVPLHFKQWGEWAPGESVERTTGTVQVATWWNGARSTDKENLSDCDGHRDDEPDVYRVGKKAACRHLDGRTWDEFPREQR